MTDVQVNTGALRRDRAVREIVRAWRELAGGRGARDDERATLVGCSGGADSSALAIALAQVGAARLVVAHVVHDMRERGEAMVDRDATRDLAARLGRPFVEGEIQTRGRAGNVESTARVLRYRSLARLAREQGCPYVAVAHHADDQLETVVMRLLRGSGARGLAGVHPTRVLSRSVTLVRPMLGVSREDSERICDAAGWEWREDATNADESRLRAAVRARVVPLLKELSPAVLGRVGASAAVLRDAADLIGREARRVLGCAARTGAEIAWERGGLRAEHAAVMGEAVRLAVIESGGGRGADRLSYTSVRHVCEAIRYRAGSEKRFTLGTAVVSVTRGRVAITRREAP